jgi:uncharacterized protein YbaA (DUF1428 family)
MFVDGFVMALPKKNIGAYTKMAKGARKVWMKHGALAYYESAWQEIDEKGIEDCGAMSFRKLAKVKEGETVIFAWILYKSKSHREKVVKLVMADPVMEKMMLSGKPMPFEMKRMAVGVFKTIVE